MQDRQVHIICYHSREKKAPIELYLKCRLQMLSVGTKLKYCRLENGQAIVVNAEYMVTLPKADSSCPQTILILVEPQRYSVKIQNLLQMGLNSRYKLSFQS